MFKQKSTKMKNLILIITTLIFASCGNSQTHEKTFLEVSLPQAVKVNPKLVHNLISDIRSKKIKNIHSLIIIKDNKLITEEYFGGFNRDELHYSASVSKSFASALLGIAIDKGFFDGDIQTVLNKNVAKLFPKYAEIILQDSLKKDLTLKHILSMTAGFEWDEHTYSYSDSRNDCNRINNSSDPMKFLFERKLIRNPGLDFYYNGGLSLSLSYLLEKYTNMSVDNFANEYLFKQLGIDDYQWDNLANGLIDTDGGLHLKPIDQAKLGYLFLNNGIWNNQQIVSKEWVTTSTKMHIKNTDMPDYAYQWWGGNYGALNQTYFIYMASGHGGQKIVVIPKFNAVVVVSQQVFNNQFGDLNFLAIMSDYLLPALSNIKPNDRTTHIPVDQLTKYEGHFVLENNSEFIDIKVKDKTLMGISSDGQENIFIPVFENIFKTRVMDLIDIYIEFIVDSSGKIESIDSDFAFTQKRYHKTNTE